MSPAPNPPVEVQVYPDPVSGDTDSDSKWTPRVLIRQAERSHSRLPGIRKVPLRAIAIIVFIALLNVLVWIAAAVVLVSMAWCGESGSRG